MLFTFFIFIWIHQIFTNGLCFTQQGIACFYFPLCQLWTISSSPVSIQDRWTRFRDVPAAHLTVQLQPACTQGHFYAIYLLYGNTEMFHTYNVINKLRFCYARRPLADYWWIYKGCLLTNQFVYICIRIIISRLMMLNTILNK